MEPNNNTPKDQEILWAKNAQIFLDLCKDQHHVFDEHDSKFTVRAMGIATFSVALFGAGASWIDPQKVGMLEWGFLTAIAAIVLTVISIAMASIVKPHLWSQPGDLSEFNKIVYSSSHADFLASVAAAYMKSVSENTPSLDSRGNKLQIIAKLILAEVVLFVVFRVCLLFPG